jgi:hypothetical protein
VLFGSAKRFIAIAALASPIFWPGPACAAQVTSEAKVVATLYRDYAWQAMASQWDLFGPGLADENLAKLEHYFTPELAKLLVDDLACKVREQGICNLDFDLLFDSQDPRVGDLNVETTQPGKVRVEFTDPVIRKKNRIDFTLVKVSGDWRIADIFYSLHAQQSLKAILSPHVSFAPK